MKIRAIIPNERGNASSHWRIMGPFTAMRRMGIDAIWYYYDDMRDADFKDAVVIVQRMIPNNPTGFIRNLMERGAINILYSVDDYTFNEDVLREYLIACGGLTKAAIEKIVERIPQQIETMQLCDDVIATTQTLLELARDVSYKDGVLLPNAIDEKWFNDGLNVEAPYRANGNIVHIGYASGRRPSHDLVVMAKAWKLIAEEFDNVRFVVAGYQPDEIDREIPLERKIRIPWKPIEQYPSSMQVDIGCCPVSDDIQFNMGKSSIKWMEYTLGGAAVVASRFYEGIILNAVNGLVTDNNVVSWTEQLRLLVESKVVRDNLQDNAYYQIHNYMTIDAIVNEWITRLKEFANEN